MWLLEAHDPLKWPGAVARVTRCRPMSKHFPLGFLVAILLTAKCPTLGGDVFWPLAHLSRWSRGAPRSL